MAARNIEGIDLGPSDTGPGTSSPAKVEGAASSQQANGRSSTGKGQHASVLSLVSINFPDPTPLSVVIREVAKWSGKSFVMEPSLHPKVQIFAPRPMRAEEAYTLFLASLSVVHLRAVEVGQVVKIVPVVLVVSA